MNAGTGQIAVKRRWLQFSLRAMLAATAGIALLVSLVVRDKTPLVPASEYAILNAAVGQGLIGQQEVGPLFLSSRTLEPNDLPDREVTLQCLMKKAPELGEGIFSDFYDRNGTVHRVEPRFRLPCKYHVTTKDRAKALVEQLKIDAPRWVVMSRPGLAPSGRTAIVYVSSARGGFGGTDLLVLGKDDDTWNLVKILPVF